MPALIALLASAAAGPLAAQDVVVMRRAIAPPQPRATPTPTPTPAVTPTPKPTATPTPAPVIAWFAVGSPTANAPSCSATAPATQAFECRSDGVRTSDSVCASLPAPQRSVTVEDRRACVTEWVAVSAPVANAPSCSATAPATQAFECRYDGAKVEDARCSSIEAPKRTTTVEDRRSCTYDWVAGGYGPYTSTCSTTATRDQKVECIRTGDTATGRIAVADSFCPAATMPKRQEGPVTVSSGCAQTVQNGTFVKEANGSGIITSWTGDIGSIETSGAGAKFKTTSGPVQLSQTINLTQTKYRLTMALTNNITFQVFIGGVEVFKHTGTPYSSNITQDVTVTPGQKTFQLRSSFLRVDGTDYGGNPVVNNVKLTAIP